MDLLCSPPDEGTREGQIRPEVRIVYEAQYLKVKFLKKYMDECKKEDFRSLSSCVLVGMKFVSISDLGSRYLRFLSIGNQESSVRDTSILYGGCGLHRGARFL